MLACWQAVAFGEGVAALLPQLSALTEILPAPTLAWKLKLLQEGNRCAAQPMLTSHLPPLKSPPALTIRLTDTRGLCSSSHKAFTHSITATRRFMMRVTQRSAFAQAGSMLSDAFWCRQLAPKLKNVGQRVLLLVGEGDWLIPSQAEGKRLETVLARCIVKACAHLSTVSGCERWNGTGVSRLRRQSLQLHVCSVFAGRSVFAGDFAQCS